MDTTKLALKIRQYILAMGFVAKGTHIAPSFSIADILAVLYNDILEIEDINDENRDRFILSKGHASSAIFAVLALKDFFDKSLLKTFCQNGTILGGHPDLNKVKGIEASTGSLGHGIGIALGMAYSAKLKNRSYLTYSIIGDGESQEGSVWESAMIASQLKLDNFVVITDYNKLQGIDFIKNISNLNNLKNRWESFGWEVFEVDGHNIKELKKVFLEIKLLKNDKPKMLIAHTIKGKGCSFMQNKAIWHYRLPNKEELKIACKELQIDDITKVLDEK
jgi:transketolase